MRRGPKTGKAGGTRPAQRDDLGPCPDTFTGPGRELWNDAVAHLKATGTSARVYRHGLLMLCRMVEAGSDDIGINRLEAVRRWMKELGLTPTASRAGAMETHGEAQDGRARILSLIDRKTGTRG